MIRRVFLRGLSTLALASVAAGLPGLGALRPAPVDLRRRLATWFTDPSEARRLGQIYLTDHPTELGGVRRLVESLGPQAHADSVERRLRALVDADFSARETVMVDGWLLARTEARVYAFLATA